MYIVQLLVDDITLIRLKCRKLLICFFLSVCFSHTQTHPNVDKKIFNDRSIIALKGEGKTFPIGQDIGVLKWRLQTNDDSFIPLFSKHQLISYSL